MCSWPPQLWNLGHLDILYLPFKLIDVFTVQVPYPDWAHWLGWVLVGISAVQVSQNFYFRFDVFVHDMDYFALVCKKVAIVENFEFSCIWLSWLPGSPVGGVDEPGVLVQEEVDQGGQADQGVGPRRSPGRTFWFNFSITIRRQIRWSFCIFLSSQKTSDYLCPGAKGNLWGAAQHRPRKKTQLQLKLQHWLRQSGTLQIMTHVHWGKIAWVFNLVKDNILSSSHISTMNFDCFQAISAYNM